MNGIEHHAASIISGTRSGACAQWLSNVCLRLPFRQSPRLIIIDQTVIIALTKQMSVSAVAAWLQSRLRVRDGVLQLYRPSRCADSAGRRRRA